MCKEYMKTVGASIYINICINTSLVQLSETATRLAQEDYTLPEILRNTYKPYIFSYDFSL